MPLQSPINISFLSWGGSNFKQFLDIPPTVKNDYFDTSNKFADSKT